MKPEYNDIPLAMLVDLLAQETEKFTHLLSSKNYGKEYEDSKKTIHELTAAIELRQKMSGSKNQDRRFNPDPSMG